MPRGGVRPGSGRPIVPDENRLKPRVMRFTDPDWQAIKTAAKKAEMGISEYIRRKVLGR